MYGLQLRIRPTASLTFRRVPFSTLEMQTYPFIPPTALSGFVERLVRLSQGEDLIDMDTAHLEYIVLPRAYHVLGALPPRHDTAGTWGYTIHATPRQGVRALDHTAFSRIVSSKRRSDGRSAANEVFQLYRWEYLIADSLEGFILHEERAALDVLSGISGWGCKLGKEGWGYVEAISDPFALELHATTAVPQTILPADEAPGAAVRLFPLYRYAWDDATTVAHAVGAGSAPIKGFYPFLAAMTTEAITTHFFSGNGVNIPASLLTYF